SSQAATLPAANNTGNLTTVTDSIVHSVIYDAKTNKATGVRTIDANTNERKEYSARVIFLCASTLGTSHILLNSTSETFQNGFANSSGAVGHYLMDHIGGGGASATVPGYLDRYFHGRRPNGIYIPRFANLNGQTEKYARGFGYQGGSSREGWKEGAEQTGFGAEFKESFKTPGPWRFSIGGFGEMLPRYDNSVTLHKTKVDKWGMAQLHIDCSHGENERMIQVAMAKEAAKMLRDVGLENVVEEYNPDHIMGNGIHEMGTARMGHDPKTSVLNAYNQCHDVDNVFITDGSCMTSSACQNPSLTYMALTARAADYAASQMKSGVL
ncbi:MAG: GMC family oxidoreductase, partial [Kordiimonadaceae bacterium]|nr:GMC family oxidoreductase [Kordiimonadaceae bacterium]